jgi:hypothetical protein
MSGPFLPVVNFSVNEFLQRAEKLAVLQSIKCSSEYNKNNIIFPKHQKQSQENIFNSFIIGNSNYHYSETT